ncbi:MAG: UDP-N-acetylglucosamine 2-epimerase (non-hydrolyzing) [Patescibacteria group bacterium]
MKKHRIALIGGARPNFMKLAPLAAALKKERLPFFIVNTGQHFDTAMAGQFFDEFGLKPDYSLKPSRASVLRQMADIILGCEKVFMRVRPAVVVVVGDVNSTLCGAIAASKLGIPVAHVEAGLRSRNSAMPEETNRILTDHISDLLFATEESGMKNLAAEGLRARSRFVGNIMIDTLAAILPDVPVSNDKFFFTTLHRAENVDEKDVFTHILDALEEIAKDAPIYLPLHPRTKKMAAAFGFEKRLKRIFTLLPPLSYRETIFYEKNARLILTDSGGIQEEASFLGVSCLTLRTETERPITVTRGTNTVAGVTKDSILAAYRRVSFRRKKCRIPLWEGKAAERIVRIIKKFLA